MKRKNLLIFFVTSRNRFSLLCLLSVLIVQQYSAQTYTFTTCGATGQNGPTQGQIGGAYTGTNPLAGQVTSNNGIQMWTVPGTGEYLISTYGASGGAANGYIHYGRGASMEGTFTLTAGQVLKIIVGQEGAKGGAGGSGGGGSFVATSANVPLIVAGGGAGGGNYANPVATIMDGRITNYGASYQSTGRATAGGGGGSFSVSGLNVNGGGSFISGGVGGGLGGSGGGLGGFGGGAGSSGSNALAAGGGGYSGGDEMYGYQVYQGQEGGGGSFNSGTNQVNAAGVNTGPGLVVITRMCAVNVTAAKNPICVGESVALSTDAVSNIVWKHDGSTLPTVNVSPTSNTTYTVIGQAATGCTTEVALTVVVNPIPNLSAVVSPSVLCVGKDATLTASGANTYTWTSLSVTGAVTTVNPPASTSYNYSGTNQFGCMSSSLVNVTVNTNQLGITSNTSVCQGSPVQLSLSNAVTYTWSTGNNFATTMVSPLTNTTYMASGTDINNCVLTNMVAVTVNQKPNVIANTNKGNVCKGESVTLTAGGATTYTWSNGLGTAASVNVTLPAETVYNYAVTGADANGCINTANVQVVANRCTGIEEAAKEGSYIRVYPNPSKGEVTLQTSNGQLSSIEVTDLSGRTVMMLDAAGNTAQMDISSLSDGVYYLKVRSTESVEIIKMVKNN